MTKQETAKLDAARKANPSAGRGTLARLTGIHENKVKTYLRRVDGAAGGKPSVQGAPRVGRSLAEFRSVYDKATIVPTKVKAALKALGAGGWEYEVQFARTAGVSLADLANFRDQFAPHIVSLREGRRAWAGSAATASAMREMI